MNKIKTMAKYNLYQYLNKLNSCDTSDSTLRELKLTQRRRTWNSRTYTILRYDKERLEMSKADIETTGLFRSVVLEDRNIKCFAPPKALDPNRFQEDFRASECIAEEFIEGTMINMFYDPDLPVNQDLGAWEIATRSSVGGGIRFFSSPEEGGMTFREMFIDTIKSSSDCSYGLQFEILPKEYCYSLVLQHPKNRIVTPFDKPSIYLVAIYSIDNETKTVHTVPFRDDPKWQEILNKTILKIPNRIEEWGFTFDELKNKWANQDSPWEIPGVVVSHKATGVRTKFRNPAYEKVRRLRGNQPKLQYRYLAMRQEAQDDINKYLEYYPEDEDAFTGFRRQVHHFTGNLYMHYMKSKVHKIARKEDIPYEYRSHIATLHNIYLDELRAIGGKINRKVVECYINGLPAARLMFSVNYSLGSTVFRKTRDRLATENLATT